MKRITAIAALIALFSTLAMGQSKRISKPNYSQAEPFSQENIAKWVGSTSLSPEWFEKSDKFWYKWKDGSGEHYYVVDPVAKTKREIFDRVRLAKELTAIIKDPFEAEHIPIKNMKLKDDHIFTFSIVSSIDNPKKEKPKDGEKASKEDKKQKGPKKTFYFEWDFNSQSLKDVTDQPAKDEYPRWANIAPDSSMVVYAKGYDLYYTDMDNLHKIMKDEKDSTFVEHRLTTDGTKDCAYGGDNYRGSDERDTTKRYSVRSILWAPDAKHFIVGKYDMKGVKELWVINSLGNPRPTLESYKYQMPGEPGPKEILMVFDAVAKTGKVVRADAWKEQSIDPLTPKMKVKELYRDYNARLWEGDNDCFYFIRKSRDLHRMDFCRYDLREDSVKVLIEERMNTYIDVFDFYKVESNGDFVVSSERSGWAQLYLYDKNGNLKRELTDGPYHITSNVELDHKAGIVYFEAEGFDKEQNPYYPQLCKVSLSGGAVTRIDKEERHHTYDISEDCKYYVSKSSAPDHEPEFALYAASGAKVMDLEKTDISRLIEAGYRYPEVFKVKAADGVTDLWGMLYKPADFDSTMVYPLIDYVYPGPQVEGTYWYWQNSSYRTHRLAQIGFIVFSVGQRGGSPERSKWYHNYGYGNMRDYPLEDHVKAAQQLAYRHKWIDIDRVGIHGHSGGGFMSTAAILTYNDFYKAAVSCAGNHDNRIYNRWWSETHHGVKEIVSDKDTTFSYSIHTNQELASRLKGHLLLVHGDIDNNVNPANTIRVVDALIRANKRFDLLILPGQRHGFGDMTEYFFWRMADHFSRYLIGDCEESTDIVQLNR
mgnify:CR=1 FL=1